MEGKVKGRDCMKVLIVCFSQTGNTRQLADKIHEGIVAGGNDCTLVDIKRAVFDDMDRYDLIGLGTPTFFYREPVNVRQFIGRMNPGRGRHCFLFCSHGSIMGNTFFYMASDLKEKGYTVIGAFDTYADASLQFYPKIWHTAGHPDEIDLKEAERFGRSICDISIRISNGEPVAIPEFQLIEDTWWAEASIHITPDSLRKRFPRFTLNRGKCTECLTCQDECPVNAIDILSDPPDIQKDGCIFCLYCQKACPEGAIEADWSEVEKMTRGNLEKYVDVLKEAEKQGRFRPYVDYEKIV
jgi:flavodoxin/NAD-dependent dihydropyrimidine dehydrogenase PreA subunit